MHEMNYKKVRIFKNTQTLKIGYKNYHDSILRKIELYKKAYFFISKYRQELIALSSYYLLAYWRLFSRFS